jgi:hypothetical protein
VARFGEVSVFLDVEMGPAQTSRRSIADELRDASAVLVVIGPQWLSEVARGYDYLHAEVVAAALDPNMRVIPVLVGGARMPAPHELPVELAPLTRRASIEVTDLRFDYDMDRLIYSLTRVLADQRALEVEPRPGLLPHSPELERMLLRAARVGIVPAQKWDPKRLSGSASRGAGCG